METNKAIKAAQKAITTLKWSTDYAEAEALRVKAFKKCDAVTDAFWRAGEKSEAATELREQVRAAYDYSREITRGILENRITSLGIQERDAKFNSSISWRNL